MTTNEESQVITPQEADRILSSLNTLTPDGYSNDLVIDEEDKIKMYWTQYVENERLINKAKALLSERLNSDDSYTLRIQDINAVISETFKQNQLLSNKATENININLKEIQEMTPDQLFELYQSLNT